MTFNRVVIERMLCVTGYSFENACARYFGGAIGGDQQRVMFTPIIEVLKDAESTIQYPLGSYILVKLSELKMCTMQEFLQHGK